MRSGSYEVTPARPGVTDCLCKCVTLSLGRVDGSEGTRDERSRTSGPSRPTPVTARRPSGSLPRPGRPITRTPSNRPRSSIRTRLPSARTASLAVFHDDRRGLRRRGPRSGAGTRCLQRPPQPAARQLRPRLGGRAGVLAPHVPAAGAAVAADRDQQRRRSPPERLVRQPPGHGVPRRRPRIRSGGTSRRARRPGTPAPRDQAPAAGPVTSRPSSSSRQNMVRSGRSEGSVRHVEVFRMGSVRTSIIGRPRPLPGVLPPGDLHC